MQYQIIPTGDFWQEGVICLPKQIAEKYIKLASEYQIKTLLVLMSAGGTAEPKDIARAIGCTENDAKEFLDFWADEGLLTADGKNTAAAVITKPAAADTPQPKKEKVRKVEPLPVPTLSPKDIIDMCRDDGTLTETLRSAQEVMGKTLSHMQQQTIINMVTYYGLPCDVVLMLLQYYMNEKKDGKSIGLSYLTKMAQDWSENGINTFEAASQKLHDLEFSDRLWDEVIALSGLTYRNPTQKQREMVKRWHDDFSIDMIGLACDAMKESAEKPGLAYVDGVLKNWKKKGITTPEDVAANNIQHKKAVQSQKTDDGIDSTYDIDELEKRAMFNDNYDI